MHTLCGRWPDVAPQAPIADVFLCHHVLYNVADIGPFVAALTAHARRRVVVELTARHPLIALNPYWQEFHGLERPDCPTADQAVLNRLVMRRKLRGVVHQLLGGLRTLAEQRHTRPEDLSPPRASLPPLG